MNEVDGILNAPQIENWRVLGLNMEGSRVINLMVKGILAVRFETRNDEIIRIMHAHSTVVENIHIPKTRSKK